jgi:hypothetical protein
MPIGMLAEPLKVVTVRFALPGEALLATNMTALTAVSVTATFVIVILGLSDVRLIVVARCWPVKMIL